MAVFISGATIPRPVGNDVFSNNTWITIVRACQMNAVPDAWRVGDQKTMTIGGADYVVEIIGKNHDTYSDGTGVAPLTLQLHDCYGTKYDMSDTQTNVGGYDSTLMHTTILPAILAAMPQEVQKGIREVNKLTSLGGMVIGVETIACKLFLLSELEIFGSIINSVLGEGKQYAYYAEGNSAAKRYLGSSDVWYTRSPSGSNRTDFCYVRADGSSGLKGATSEGGVSFAFCF